jgi:hypothetical protein
MKDKSPWTNMHSVALLLILATIALVGLLVPPSYRFWAWLATLILLDLFAIIAGQGITGIWYGVLIDEHNKMSLSRMQMVLWTIVVLSGILTAALSNIGSGQPDPLAIALPTELWLLMGISTTTLVASPLILSTKTNKPTDEAAAARTFNTIVTNQHVDPDMLDTKGEVIVNTNAAAARWSDMFRGEEVANGGQLDLGKIQMFYFTLILIFAYASAMGAMFAAQTTARIGSFPALDASMIALLGISHAGYLTSKAIPHS